MYSSLIKPQSRIACFSARAPGLAASFLIPCLLLAATLPARADYYPKIEAAFSITNLATDPFDYTVTDVRVQVTQPDSTALSLPAFFDGGTTWRVRHTPTQLGLYQITGITLNGSPLAVSNLQPSSWTVTGTPTSAGYVRVDPANTNKFITSNGRRYYPLGHDVAWWTNNTNLPSIMLKLGGSRENWSRIWMMDFYDGLNLEWPKVGSLGQYSLGVAQKWDAIVSAAEQSGVSFQMVLQYHGQYSTTVNPEWSGNPYNTANGGFLPAASQFFTNATAKAYSKRKYRYIVARWGYSPAIMAWELFNEVQFTDAGQSSQWVNIGAWHTEMVQFLRTQDFYQHLITTSSDNLSQSMWTPCDYYQHHDYPTDYISALRDPVGIPGGQPIKPIFGGESGSNGVPYLGFHAPLWAGIMGAQSGAAQQWYGDGLDADNAYNLYRAGRDFALLSGLAEQDTLNKTAPHVTCPQNSSLVFAPGASFVNATQDSFVVGDVAPDGIGTLPSFLQGNFHRSMTPNGYTFQVNYPPGGGTFSAQILQIALSGAGLLIYLDNVIVSSNSFPATPANVNTNLTIPISVSAGAHTIKLWNQGQDWIVLGNLTFNPYVPMLGAYQIGNTNFAALWFWHRTNIYYPNASATVSGTFPLSGLQPGTYNATWWDTFADTAISNFTFTVSDTNPVTVTTPAILRSVAFFAGKPAQAGINAPNLTQTVGTNAPPINVQLMVTNNGGLPLSYSLSVTGANSITYAAINSSQPGGPFFAWKDISVVGSNLTSAFTALAGPKTAKDEGIAGPVNIGFGFPFFSGAQSPDTFTQLYVSPNGFVTFSPFGSDTSTNTTLPNALAPTNLIAFFWDDLDLGSGGRVYALSDPIGGAFTLQFQNVLFKGSGATASCQLILKTSGEILVQYKSAGISNACTVGVQNAAGSQGLQVAYNQAYVQSNLCVRLSPTPWFGLAASAGLVPKSNVDIINLSLDASKVPAGTYSATLLVKTADPASPLTVLPVSLNILTAPTGLAVTNATWTQVGLTWQDNSTNETGFAVERKTGTNGVYSQIATVGAGVPNFTDTNVTSRTTYGYRVRAFNAAGYSAYTGEVITNTPMSPIEAWRFANFGSADNSGNAANDADPDNDGLINIFEYAFNTNPTNANGSPISVGLAGDHLTITFLRTHPRPEDITYVFEVTDDVSSPTWQSGPGFTTQVVTDNLDGTETVIVTDDTAVSENAAHYLRVRISSP